MLNNNLPCYRPIDVSVGGLLVSVLVGPKVRGFKPGRGRWIFKGVKIRSTTFFERKVKPPVPCLSFYGTLRNSVEYERDTSSAKIHGHFSPNFFFFATRCLCWLLPENSGS
jgi:hypothetical protein